MYILSELKIFTDFEKYEKNIQVQVEKLRGVILKSRPKKSTS
jgi:hypothetical protein